MPDGKMKKTAQGKEETHMTELLKLPVGIENFEEIRRDDFYYVDKTIDRAAFEPVGKG